MTDMAEIHTELNAKIAGRKKRREGEAMDAAVLRDLAARLRDDEI